MLGTSTYARPITSCKTTVSGTSMIASWLGRNNGIGWVALPCLALSEGRFPFELNWQLCGGGWGCQYVATFNYHLQCSALELKHFQNVGQTLFKRLYNSVLQNCQILSVCPVFKWFKWCVSNIEVVWFVISCGEHCPTHRSLDSIDCTCTSITYMQVQKQVSLFIIYCNNSLNPFKFINSSKICKRVNRPNLCLKGLGSEC